MQLVALVEQDGLLREILRERLEAEGYEVCPVATVRAAIEATQWCSYVAVLASATSVLDASSAQREALAALDVPVLLLHRAHTPLRAAVEAPFVSEALVWSATNLEPVVCALKLRAAPAGPPRSRSGTYRRSSSSAVAAAPSRVRASVVPAPAPPVAHETLGALSALVLAATGTRDT